MKTYPLIEIPFNCRATCWFCGEPSESQINFPKQSYEETFISHRPLCLPTCKECATIVKRSAFVSLYSYRDAIKKALMVKHQKLLSIGLNWTKQELEESQLEGSAFAGFKESAWFMFEMMQARINYQGWDLVVNNQKLDIQNEQEPFEFDGTIYSNLDTAVEHVTKTFYIDEQLFTRVLTVQGKAKFGQVIRLCRLYPALKNREREQVFLDILESLNL